MARQLSTRALGALEAGRLLQQSKAKRDRQIPVFDLIHEQKLEIVFRPLKRLFGAYLPPESDTPGGVLLSSNLPRAVQRFTAAHELGHHMLKHSSVIDDERRVDDPRSPMERGADGFAERLLMPQELIDASLKRLGLADGRVRSFEDVYQLALEVGVSYRATVKRLQTLNYISRPIADDWFRMAPRRAKESIVSRNLVEDYRRDTYRITLADSRNELVVREGDLIAVE